jgi:alcohol dehydrogenase class IV
MAAIFQFATATRIVFGAGKVGEVAAEAREMGFHALVATGRDPDRAAGIVDALRGADLAVTTFAFEGEPTVAAVRQGVELARAMQCDLVIAFGGGSPIDGGKAIAAILGNGGDPLDYLEVVGKGQKIHSPSVPFIAIPTTAGTGSEVTRNAVLASTEHKVKASLRSPLMLPRLAVVDPELTLDLPPAITASTGLDALTQLIEPYVSARRNPMTDMFCLEGVRRAGRSLGKAFREGGDVAARTDMAMASLLGGLSLANAGLGVVHGFAAPLGGMFPAPHGAVCAALLPHGMAMNLKVMRERDQENESFARYEEIARILTADAEAIAEDGVRWIAQLVEELQIPRLAAYGLTESDVPAVVEKAARASSMKANPIVLDTGELTEVLTRAL